MAHRRIALVERMQKKKLDCRLETYNANTEEEKKSRNLSPLLNGNRVRRLKYIYKRNKERTNERWQKKTSKNCSSTNRDSCHVHIDIPFDCHIHSPTCGLFNLRRRRRRHYIRLMCINNKREGNQHSQIFGYIRKPKINSKISYDLLFSIFAST